MHRLLAVAALLVTVAIAASHERPQLPLSPDKVALSDIKVLTFTAGEMTAHRRVSAIEQLKCHRGCQYGRPDTAQCTNLGTDGKLPRWQCEAPVPDGVFFSRVDVSCEGYQNSQDTNVLVGSCALNYQLSKHRQSGSSGGHSIEGSELVVILFFAVTATLVVLALVLHGALRKDLDAVRGEAKRDEEWLHGHRSADDSRTQVEHHYHNSGPSWFDFFMWDQLYDRNTCHSAGGSGWSSSSSSSSSSSGSGWSPGFGGTILR